MAEEQSIVSSLAGSALEVSNGIVEKGLVEKLKISLARDAAAKTILNGGHSGEQVVKSPHIERMAASYIVAATGRVSVMCELKYS